MKKLMPGDEILPGWRVIRVIGKGSYGTVYEAEKTDEEGESFHSAIKVISVPQSPEEYEAYIDDGYDEESITTIFRSQVDTITKEFTYMSRFRGVTNIVSCEDHAVVPHEDGHGWDVIIRMELLTSLTEMLKKNDLTEKEIVQLGVDICTALELCAQRNVIHRDIKPQNVFVNEFGNFKLGDFGVAKTMDHATHGTRIGTVHYMAPEIYANRRYDARIDQYSLGLMMYWLLNERRLPFLPLPPAVATVSQQNEAMERRMNGEPIPRPAHGNDALAEVVLKACAYDPNDRYENATEMKYALYAAMASAKRDAVTIGLNNRDKGNIAPEPAPAAPASDEKEETIGIFAGRRPEKTEPEKKTEPEPAPAVPSSDKGEETMGIFAGRNPGKPQSEESVVTEPKPEPKPEPKSEPKSEPKPKPVPRPEPKPVPKPAKTEKSGKKKTVVIAVIAALVVLAVLLAIVLGGKKKPEKPQNETDGETERETVPETEPETKPETKPETEPETMPETDPYTPQYKVGDSVYFGAYEQNNNLSDGKEIIEWIVLEVDGEKALLISKYALDCIPYHSEYTSVTWETCDLRQWLNETFLNSTFSADEQEKIVFVPVSADKNPEYDTTPGNGTKDKVFLLSIGEVEKLLSTDEERRGVLTAYAKRQGALVFIKPESSRWWLRSPGNHLYTAVAVNYDGSVGYSGFNVDYDDVAVRPALWITLDS